LLCIQHHQYNNIGTVYAVNKVL